MHMGYSKKENDLYKWDRGWIINYASEKIIEFMKKKLKFPKLNFVEYRVKMDIQISKKKLKLYI